VTKGINGGGAEAGGAHLCLEFRKVILWGH
jgi:hypothetical protein